MAVATALSLPLLSASAVLAADDDDGPSQTLRSEALTSEELAALQSSTTTTSSEPEPVEVLPVGPPLTPGATAEDIRAVMESMHGPTDDVAGQMNRLAAFPAVDTPPGAYITEVRVDARSSLDGAAVIVVTEVALDADGSPEELIDFFADDADGLGWTQTGRHGRSSSSAGAAHRLTYQIPDSPYILDDFTVVVTAPSPGDERSQVLVRYVEVQAPGQDDRANLAGWAQGIPFPEGGEIWGAAVQTSAVGRHSIHLSLAVRYPASEPEAIAAGLRSTLPGAGFELVETPSYGSKLDNWVYLAGAPFDSAWISPHSLRTGALAGSTLVQLDARLAFTPEPLK